MAITIAEYYGQRTDLDNPTIRPINHIAKCPFMNNDCMKLKSSTPKPPICSVRKTDGKLWIVCEHRLCSTTKNLVLSTHQQTILLDVAKNIYSDSVQLSEICVKREASINVSENSRNPYKADFIMSTISGYSPFSGPDRLVVEMQGGGETSNTGDITKHIKIWEQNNNRTNLDLRTAVQSAGTIETNAWRRQQEQFIIKGNVAMKTWKGLGIAFCIGEPLFDYIMNRLSSDKLPDLKNHNWTLALLSFKEDTSIQKKPGPIPIIVNPTKSVYTNYQTFVQALINQGLPTIESFIGEFITLDNKIVEIKNRR